MSKVRNSLKYSCTLLLVIYPNLSFARNPSSKKRMLNLITGTVPATHIETQKKLYRVNDGRGLSLEVRPI